MKMSVFTDESTSQETKEYRQTSKEQEENTQQFVENLGRKQVKENRKRKFKVEEREVQGDVPERKKKKKKMHNKSMEAKKDEKRSVEEQDIEQAIEEGYRPNKEIRRIKEEKHQNNTPEIKKTKNKHKGQETNGNKQRSVEEDKEKHVKDFRDMRQEKETRKLKREVEVQNDVPREKNRKHKSQEIKEIEKRSAEEEDKEKHVEDFRDMRQEKETRKREVEVQNDVPREKNRKHKSREIKEIEQRSAEEEEDKEKHVEDFRGIRQEKETRKTKREVEVQNDVPREKNRKHKSQEIKEIEQRSAEEEEDKEKQEKETSKRKEVNPDLRNKVKPKKSKKKTKAHPIGGLPLDEDINPIHFDWELSEATKQKFNVRKGKWTKQEEKILRENMEQFLLDYNLDDPSKLIFSRLHGDSEEAKKWKAFTKTTDFYRKLGKGLNRSIFLIYRKVLRLFDEENYQGPFTESEDRELEKLVTIHGRKWEKIGRMMGRSGLAVSHRYSWNCGTRGKWKDSEVDLLKEAVRNVTNTTEGEEMFTNIDWSAVASTVKTRNAEQCRKKWIYNICWKETTSAPCRIWSWKDDLKLIKLVYESSVTNESDIDWCELQKHFEIARSPEWLSTKFKLILRKHCTSIYLENTDFEEVIDYLHNVKGKELEDKFDDN